jgi:hypothetical protein
MAVYKIFPSKDSTIYSVQSELNAGRDEILEISVKNINSISGISENVGASNIDDIRRSLLYFTDDDINIIKGFKSASFSSNLRLFLADAENLSQDYTIECYPLSQNWVMGTGKFNDNPITTNGVSWKYTGQTPGQSQWNNTFGSQSYLFTSGGGTWNESYTVTQSFDYVSNKDININITPILTSWFTGSINNYGVILKHEPTIELNTGSYIDLKYFSIDTHTIYPPCIDFKWDDSLYNTGSVNTGIISSGDFVLNVSNNLGEFKKDTKYNFQIKARDKFPQRQFTTSSVYLNWKYLPITSYWGLQDFKTTEMVVDFDTEYTKISANNTGNYFTVYMNGLQPERTYKLLIKTILQNSEEIVVDNDILFKIVR